MDMLARTPSEMETAYKNLEVMKEVLKKACDDLKSFDVSAVVGQAEEKLRMVYIMLYIYLYIYNCPQEVFWESLEKCNRRQYNFPSFGFVSKGYAFFPPGHGCFGEHIPAEILVPVP